MIELMEHQKRAIERARALPHLALFYAPGTGKTATIIRILAEEFDKGGKIRNTLIFAPLTVCPQWKVEFSRFSEVPASQILVLTESGQKRVEALKRAIDSGHPFIAITNYEGVRIQQFYDLLLKWSPHILVGDESHRLKNSKSKQAKRIYPLFIGADRRFILTGTHIVNSLMDVFGQYKALSPDVFGGNPFRFRDTYFFNKNAGKMFGFPEWVMHPWSERGVGEKIKPTSLQVSLEECVDLPEVLNVTVPVKMHPAQYKAYQEMKKEFLTELNGMVSTSEFEIVKIIRMQQILCGFIQPDEKNEPEWFKYQPRLDALMDTIDGLGSKQCIVWTNFVPTYRQIGDALEKKKITHTFITGQQTTEEKLRAVESFKSGAKQVVIANAAAAGEGIDGLQVAQYAIYYSRSYNLSHFIQSKARTLRKGSEKHKKVVYFHLVAPNTLDEVILKALDAKQRLSDSVMAWAKEISCNLHEK